jgi:hypothetical protein
MPSKVQLIGGVFQDSEGNVLANGYLIMKLNQDENVTGVGQICSGIDITINLDVNGSVSTSPQQFVWGNDQMLPVNSYYRVFGYKSNGQLAWGPNNQQVIGDGGTFDVGTWIPNTVFSWTPPPQPLELQTNETPNGDQFLLDLHAGSGVTLVDNGSGRVTISASGTPLSLETNGVVNGSQALLNLKNGTNISVTDDGVGGVTITNTQPAATGFPLPNTYRVMQHYPGGGAFPSASSPVDTFLGDSGFSSGSGSGITGAVISAKNTTTTLGPTWNLKGTGATAGFLTVFVSTASVFAGRNFIFQSAGSVTDSDVSGRGMIGLSEDQSVMPSGASLPTNVQYAMFAYEPGTSSNWILYVCDGAAMSSFTTSVPANSSPHYFEIDFTSGVSAEFKIDGSSIHTFTTHIPNGTTLLQPFFQINPYGAATIGINCAHIYVAQPLF